MQEIEITQVASKDASQLVTLTSSQISYCPATTEDEHTSEAPMLMIMHNGHV